MKVLNMRDFGVKEALRHPLLGGRKLIGRGMFAAVFEGTRPSTVIKLTADSVGYWLLNDVYVGVKHWHFPRVRENFGEVGEANVNGRAIPLYMFEVERLERVKGEARKLARLVSSKERSTHWSKGPETATKLSVLGEDKALPRSVRNAFKQMREFCAAVPGGDLDMHMGNFMQRPNGELVMSDPIMDSGAWRARHWPR